MLIGLGEFYCLESQYCLIFDYKWSGGQDGQRDVLKLGHVCLNVPLLVSADSDDISPGLCVEYWNTTCDTLSAHWRFMPAMELGQSLVYTA